ncbi:MAG: putative nucleotidyltransferase substrate binding domain-containing protein [Actinomycetota bacterium]
MDMTDADTDTGAVARTLRRSLPVDGLTEAQLRAVASAASTERYPAGTAILHQGGDPAAALYVIGSGHVEIRVDGRLVDSPGPGEVFGELSLLAGSAPTASVRASEDVECLMLGRDAAASILGTGGGVAFVQESLRRSMSQALDTDGRSMLDAIETADDETAAVARLRALPEGVCSLVESGADATKIGRVIGASVDALTRRLLSFAMADLGAPPVPWAWLALGSEARLEQALHTDQDHALAYDPGDRTDEELDGYFAGLAERVTAGLEAAGIPRCNGDAMAIYPGLRRPLASWAEAFRSWMADPGVDGSILSSIAFDFRRVDGPLDVEPALHAVLATAASRYPQFIRHLTRRALDRKPPSGFLKNLVVESKGEHAGRLDIKHGGVTIVTNIARAYAIAGGRPEKGTFDRLTAAEAAGQIDAERRQALDEAFRLLWQIRLEHQVWQVEGGETTDDFVDPARLGPIARSGLKEAFKIVGHEQQMLAADLGVDL